MENPEILDARGKPRVQTINTMESCTVQSDRDQADIRQILKRYKAVGLVDHLNQAQGQYLDISNLEDYAQVMRNVKEAEELFLTLPSKIREKFNHNVANFLDAAHDPEKRQELVDLGILEGTPTPSDPTPEPPPGEVPSPPSEAPAAASPASTTE